jgi:hypothetical protein
MDGNNNNNQATAERRGPFLGALCLLSHHPVSWSQKTEKDNCDPLLAPSEQTRVLASFYPEEMGTNGDGHRRPGGQGRHWAGRAGPDQDGRGS